MNIVSPSFPRGLPALRSEAEARKELTKCCPFCGEDPPLGWEVRTGWYMVGCTSDDCFVCPQICAPTLTEAWRRWNTRARS